MDVGTAAQSGALWTGPARRSTGSASIRTVLPRSAASRAQRVCEVRSLRRQPVMTRHDQYAGLLYRREVAFGLAGISPGCPGISIRPWTPPAQHAGEHQVGESEATTGDHAAGAHDVSARSLRSQRSRWSDAVSGFSAPTGHNLTLRPHYGPVQVAAGRSVDKARDRCRQTSLRWR